MSRLRKENGKSRLATFLGRPIRPQHPYLTLCNRVSSRTLLLLGSGFAVARLQDWSGIFSIRIGSRRCILYQSLFRTLPVDVTARSLTKGACVCGCGLAQDEPRRLAGLCALKMARSSVFRHSSQLPIWSA